MLFIYLYFLWIYLKALFLVSNVMLKIPTQNRNSSVSDTPGQCRVNSVPLLPVTYILWVCLCSSDCTSFALGCCSISCSIWTQLCFGFFATIVEPSQFPPILCFCNWFVLLVHYNAFHLALLDSILDHFFSNPALQLIKAILNYNSVSYDVWIFISFCKMNDHTFLSLVSRSNYEMRITSNVRHRRESCEASFQSFSQLDTDPLMNAHWVYLPSPSLACLCFPRIL